MSVIQDNTFEGVKMNIKVIKDATDDTVNRKCYELESNGYEIIDIIFTHESYNHYVNYAVIKYKLKRI